MDIHEYQAKAILAEFGMPVGRAALPYSPEQAVYLGQLRWHDQPGESGDGHHAGVIVTSVGESSTKKVDRLREASIGIIVRPSVPDHAVEAALANL